MTKSPETLAIEELLQKQLESLEGAAKNYLGEEFGLKSIYAHLDKQQLKYQIGTLKTFLFDELRSAHQKAQEAMVETNRKNLVGEGVFTLDQLSKMGFIMNIINTTWKFLSAAAAPILYLASGFTGLSLGGLMTLGDLYDVVTNADGPIRGTRGVLGAVSLGLIALACACVVGVLVSPVALPLIFCGLMGFTAWTEHRKSQEYGKEIEILEEDIQINEAEVDVRIKLILRDDPHAIEIQKEMKDLQETIDENPNQSESEKQKLNQLQKKLTVYIYAQPQIRELSARIETDKEKVEELKIKKAAAEKKRDAAIFGVTGAVCLALSPLFAPLALIGVMFMLFAAFEHKGAAEQEKAALKKLKEPNSTVHPLVKRIDGLHAKINNLETKPKR